MYEYYLYRTSECPEITCKKVFDPQCASDGQWYSNVCELEKATCRDQTLRLNPDKAGCLQCIKTSCHTVPLMLHHSAPFCVILHFYLYGT